MKISVISGAAVGLVAAVLLGAYLIAGVGSSAANTGRQVSPEQFVIVRDGSVTDAEYLQASQGMVGCLRDAGLAVSDPDPGPQGRYGYHYLEGAASLDIVHQREAIVRGCYDQNLGEVDRVWQLSPDHKQSAEELGFSIQRCVESRKSDFRFSDDNETLIRQVVTFRSKADADFEACWSEVVRSVFASTGQTTGSVDIAYRPLPR